MKLSISVILTLLTVTSAFGIDRDVNYIPACVESAKAQAVIDYEIYDAKYGNCKLSKSYLTVRFSKRLSMGISTNPLIHEGRRYLVVIAGEGAAGPFCPSNLEYSYYFKIDRNGYCTILEE